MTEPAHMKDPEFRPTWKNRRRTIFGTLALDALVVIAVVVGWFIGLDVSAAVATIVSACILRSTAVVASYVFGAAWEDIRLWKSP